MSTARAPRRREARAHARSSSCPPRRPQMPSCLPSARRSAPRWFRPRARSQQRERAAVSSAVPWSGSFGQEAQELIARTVVTDKEVADALAFVHRKRDEHRLGDLPGEPRRGRFAFHAPLEANEYLAHRAKKFSHTVGQRST